MDDREPIERFVRPSRSPPHLFRPNATYFITAKTLHGERLLNDDRKQQVIDAFRFACDQRSWQFVAWVVLSNHYHLLLLAPEDADSLPALMKSVHWFTAVRWNGEDGRTGRKLWYRYRDTCVDHERSFWARLNYIHNNPVKHGLVKEAAEYPFSSYHHLNAELDLKQVEGAYPWELLNLED